MEERDDGGRRSPATTAAWIGAAVLLYGAVTTVVYADVWRAGFRNAIAFTFTDAPVDTPVRAARMAMRESDALYTVWVVGRNAYTLLHHPSQLFDGERCYPTRLSMALGESMLSLSLLGLPAALVTGDPVATYNFALALNAILSGLAMFWLVWRWSGEPAAGLTAGLLYALHTVNPANALHPYIHDTAWMVWGLYFARAWFVSGRWRHALGLAAACALQLSASLYPILAAVLVALPVIGWLVVQYRPARPGWAQIAAVGATLIGVSLVVFGPYVELRETTDIRRLAPSPIIFGPWSSLLPGGRYFPGWLTAVLGIAGLTLRPRPEGRVPRGDPRVSLVAGALLAALFAAGGNAVAVRDGTAPFALPNPYLALSTVLPGLDQVRAIASLFSGVFVVETLLAGLGAAALLQRVAAGRRRLAAIGLVALAIVYTVRPGLPLDRQIDYRPYTVRPATATLDFYDTLAAIGNKGPILEVPMDRHALVREGAALMASAYHHRPTSACTDKSFSTELSYEIDELGARLPDADALARIREIGFTTVIVHHPPGRRWSPELARALRAAARGDDAGLRRLHGTASLTADAIEPIPAPTP